VTLGWSADRATSLSISGIGTVTGTHIDVNPTDDTEYVLTASNSAGSAQARVQVTIYPSPGTWFAPYAILGGSGPGSLDYFELFNSDAPWTIAASHIQVFKIYEGVLTYPDAELRRLFADLRRRHIALAMEFGALLAGDCGDGIEGFRGDRGLQSAQRIRDLGGVLQYVAFDEPYDFGALYDGPNACHYSADEVAQNVLQSVTTLRSIFPDLIVGDIEVVPVIEGVADWLDRYEQWLDAWTRAAGAPLTFLHFDVPIDGDWRAGVEALRRAVKSRNISFGLIYVGEGNSDSEWVARAEQFASDYENRGSTLPDQRIFQSWVLYPTHVLPETDPTTFTYAIDRYFRTRTRMQLQLAGPQVQGTLEIAGTQAPVAGAPVDITATPLLGTGQLTTYVSSGAIPAGTKSVTFGARINTECVGSGSADVTLSDFVLDAGAAGTLTADFTNQLNDWGTWGNASTIEVRNGLLHVVVGSSESFGLNHVAQPLTADGAPFQLRIRAALAAGTTGTGCLIAVFQDVTREISRQSLVLGPLPIPEGRAETAIDGSYTQSMSVTPSVDFELWADYSGSETLWPSAAFQRIARTPPLTIETNALPPASVGIFYSVNLAATGGKGPYLWVGAGLPPGLALQSTGTLAGMPTAAGTYAVDASVVDDATPSGVAERPLALTVN